MKLLAMYIVNEIGCRGKPHTYVFNLPLLLRLKQRLGLF